MSFRAILLGITVLGTTAVVLPLGWAITGNPMGLVAGAAAGGVCLLAAWTVLGVCERLRRPKDVLAFVALGMTLRMGIPLAAALIVILRGGPLADAGFLYYLVVFYPVTLAVETFLSLRDCEPKEKDGRPVQNFVG